MATKRVWANITQNTSDAPTPSTNGKLNQNYNILEFGNSPWLGCECDQNVNSKHKVSIFPLHYSSTIVIP